MKEFPYVSPLTKEKQRINDYEKQYVQAIADAEVRQLEIDKEFGFDSTDRAGFQNRLRRATDYIITPGEMLATDRSMIGIYSEIKSHGGDGDVGPLIVDWYMKYEEEARYQRSLVAVAQAKRHAAFQAKMVLEGEAERDRQRGKIGGRW
jgi:hypothetical protein